jgi:hypothetical protein
VLEGLRAIRLIGTVGPPPGLITDPAGQVAYVRTADAAAAAAVSGGVDSLSYAGYDGFRGNEPPVVVSATVRLRFAPLARAVESARTVAIPAGAAATLFPSTAAADRCPPPTCIAYVVVKPSRGALYAAAKGPPLSFPQVAAGVPCAPDVQGWAAPATLVYMADAGGGGTNYSAMELVLCGLQGRLHQSLRIAVACATGRIADPATGLCRSCAGGTGLSSHGTGTACSLCPPGRVHATTLSGISASNFSNTANSSVFPRVLKLDNATNATNTSTALAAAAAAAASELCQVCPAGTYAAEPGLTACLPCPPGTYSGGPGAAACAACPVGTWGPGGGAECVDCGSVAYGPVPGLSACLACPEGTVTQSRRAVTGAQCECMGGKYLLSALRGEACRPCPVGAYCEGNQAPPVVRDHFWTALEVPPVSMPKFTLYRLTFHTIYRCVCRCKVWFLFMVLDASGFAPISQPSALPHAVPPDPFCNLLAGTLRVCDAILCQMWTAEVAATAPCDFRMVRGVCRGFPTVCHNTRQYASLAHTAYPLSCTH